MSGTVASVGGMNKCIGCGETLTAGGWVKMRSSSDHDHLRRGLDGESEWIAGDAQWTCYDCHERLLATANKAVS